MIGRRTARKQVSLRERSRVELDSHAGKLVAQRTTERAGGRCDVVSRAKDSVRAGESLEIDASRTTGCQCRCADRKEG